MTALDLIAAAGQLGLTLWAKANGKLGFKAERLCPPEFKAKLKTHKAELLTLLQAKGVTWIEVHSERIGETIFFCADEATRNVLVEAGAEAWSIYTKGRAADALRAKPRRASLSR
jgi:hypothetical protein